MAERRKMPMKNGVGKTKAIPIKNSKSDTKKGFRERPKIPRVTNSPRLLELIPNRKDVLNATKERYKVIIETSRMMAPSKAKKFEDIIAMCKISVRKVNRI